MTAQAKLEVNLVVKGSFKVGANPQPPNQFDLSITNKGDALQLTSKNCLYLSGSLGSGEKALFLDEADARNCNKSGPKGWTLLWDFSSKAEGIFRLRIYSFNIFEKDQNITIAFSNVISNTAPDADAVLSFATGFSDDKQVLTIPKAVDKPGIISFYSDPPEGVQNFPGDEVALKWRTFELTNRELLQKGVSDPLPCNFEKAEGVKNISCEPVDMTFSLTGFHGAQKISRELIVNVLPPGWHPLKNTVLEGDSGYPVPGTEAESLELERITKGIDLEPTLLLYATDHLYAIFRLRFAGRESAFLFQTQNPFGGWRFVESSVPNQKGFFIPKGCITSPGVYCNDKLWLIGGSQIDPDNTSNRVWRFDPEKKAWEDCGAAKWPPRMGHSVQVFFEDQKEKIWVMGGRDEAGNALNDVWVLDVDQQSWVPLAMPSAAKIWEPRCLFSTAVHEHKIWLYGGAKEPFSAELYDDLYVYTGGGIWQKKEMTGIIKGSESKKPIASSLQVFKGKLCLFGKFRTIDPADKSERVEPLAFSLASASTKTWEDFPSDGLKGWGPDTTFSYQLVNFKDKMLIARALGYDKPNPVLQVYVAG